MSPNFRLFLLFTGVFCLLFYLQSADAQNYPPRSDGQAVATLIWTIPDSRENGAKLDVSEIGGYEVLYRIVGTDTWLSEVIPDGAATTTEINGLANGTYEFAIAAFDMEEIYSKYASANAPVNIESQSPPEQVIITITITVRQL